LETIAKRTKTKDKFIFFLNLKKVQITSGLKLSDVLEATYFETLTNNSNYAIEASITELVRQIIKHQRNLKVRDKNQMVQKKRLSFNIFHSENDNKKN
jgi:hypothetical protein